MNRRRPPVVSSENPVGETCILAGGLSTRMGRDKALLRLGRRTVLGVIRATATELGMPVRVIRRDLVPRCGPLGGVYTALKTTDANVVLFLSCDMPLASANLLRQFSEKFSRQTKALFTTENGTAGFPFALHREILPLIEAQLAQKQFSLQKLARITKAKRFHPPSSLRAELLNINTPADWARARRQWRTQQRNAAIP